MRAFAWALRLAALWAVLGLFAPAAPQLASDLDGPVVTNAPHLCVHTRLIDEVEPWKIQRSLWYTRMMGAPTIVEFFPWAYLQPEPGRYAWAQADAIVALAEAQGLRVIARLGLVPAWVHTRYADPEARARATLNTLPASAYPAFAQFAAAFAARYAGRVDHVIIWNEPNLAFEWGYQPHTPADYAALLAAVYPAVHAANPAAVVLAAPLAPTLEPPGSPHGLNDLLYLRALYEAGAAASFDALAVHTYGFTTPPDAEPAFDRLNFRRAELLRAIMVEFGDAAKPVFITETGWNDSPRWANAVSPGQRIAHTLAALTWAAERWPWAETVCLWMLRTPGYTYSYPDHFTLLSPDFEPKPIYHAVQAYAQGDGRYVPGWLPAPVGPAP
jgi:hypothetical protein